MVKVAELGGSYLDTHRKWRVRYANLDTHR